MTAEAKQIGVGYGGSLQPSAYGPLAAALDAHGFDVITVFGDLMMQPPAMVMQTMCAATDRIRLGSGCYTPWTRHPVEIAGEIAYLDNLSNGRIFMGIARGAWMDQLHIDSTRSIAAIRDTLGVVSAVLEAEGGGYQGSVYSIDAGTAPHYPVLRRAVPVMVGTWSPRLAHLAGEVADQVQVGGSANPRMVPVMAGLVAPGEAAAGRAPGSVDIVLTAITVVDDDRDAARRRARTEVALSFQVIAGLDRTHSIEPGLLDRMEVLLRQHHYEEAGRLIPEDVLDDFAFCGTPGDLVDHTAQIYDAGARRVEFCSPLGLTPQRGVELLGTKVVPELRRMGYLA
ncbi:LLM class flavin-dependent oxidoreductase [Tsukamurella sp. 8F]|uniref:LLM class flavin-dependent oxidoreductase n=1 Tax=unclassified Tsukamurella TaxID=2633480 RepID=UPI0023B9394A|nr:MULTISPECIES: LLM class flavin-dependent oxidoreductase [unclassified Tsukamurella]MDF0528468.1 LLM class flavin-dependent oxidoreductase [Tsukamurella sp. 8J]MDF0586294.1 LLM class flavin-dependent oxidoreductase [Tsukamurella sp. 8F]